MKADLFEEDLSQATVITMFLLPSINLKLRPTMLDLKPGTRIVSNTFTMGDWEADETARLDAARVAKPRGARRFSGSCLRRSAGRTRFRRGS